MHSRTAILTCCFLVLGFMTALDEARAACTAARTISSFDIQASHYSYVYTPGIGDAARDNSSISADIDGAFWQVGFGNPDPGVGTDNGTFPAYEWVYVYPNYPAWIESSWAQDDSIDGCPDSAPDDRCTAILLNDLNAAGNAFFALLTAQAGPTLNYNFAQADSAAITLAPVPEAFVTNSQSVGGEVEVTVEMEDVPPEALYLDDPDCSTDLVLGFKVYVIFLPRGAEPPSNDRRIHWMVAEGGEGPDGAPIPTGEAATVTIGQCSADTSIWLAGSVVFDSGFETTFFGGQVGIECGLCFEIDSDFDGYPSGPCTPPEIWDCDDGDPTIYPGAPARCDGKNNDCSDLLWPLLEGTEEADDDEDGFSECAGDCLDDNDAVYPGAAQICDGVNNDCDDPDWPDPSGTVDGDRDGDGFTGCEADCDDDDAAVFPGALEVCNGLDDDCDTQVDDDADGVDSDGDGVANACDNCRFQINPSQLDTDGDGFGNSCDTCVFTIDPDQEDADEDLFGDACDNCPLDFNTLQFDLDGDGAGDACDNCLFVVNPSQGDVDADFEGDACDLDDGLIHVTWSGAQTLDWQPETGFTVWNVYRGDLSVLRSEGLYSQAPGANPVADRRCALDAPFLFDDVALSPGQVAFTLVTGSGDGGEGSLGQDSEGNDRPNVAPCP